jgi:signal transduction histidine kinase
MVMRPEDFRPDDLFAQIQGLVDGLTAERDARHAAEAADKAKSDLLAMIGHELRTPMEAAVAMTELLLASPLDPTQARYAETLYACSTTCSTSPGSRPVVSSLSRFLSTCTI